MGDSPNRTRPYVCLRMRLVSTAEAHKVAVVSRIKNKGVDGGSRRVRTKENTFMTRGICRR